MLQKLPFLIFLACVCLSCNQAEKRKLVENAPSISVTYTDATGREVRLQKIPQKVISMAPNITEMIFLIGAQDKLAARSQACDYPPEAFDYPEITTYPAIDREQLKATQADMLLATDELFGPDALASIEEVGIPVYLQSYDSIAMVFDAIKTLGAMLEVEENAAQISDSLQQVMSAVAAKTISEVQYGTLIIVSSDPLIVVGGKGFLNEMIRKAGGKNVMANETSAYAKTTVEAILATKPEFVILPSKSDQAYAELINLYPSLIETPADKNKHVYIVNPDLFYRPGPRMLDGLLELTSILHASLNRGEFVGN